MAESLRDAARQTLALLADSFVYRKLGLCYDYFAAPGALPNPGMPQAKDIRQMLPNPAGIGSGMADCAVNNALLFDAYATRLEIGFAAADDERIFDRLVGGLIRLATIAPKNTVIRGLAPDGKSYYPHCGYEAVLYWAYNAWRAVQTPTVASESQVKIRNICQHWMENLEQNKFQILGRDETLNSGGAISGVVKPALLAVAFALTGQRKWREQALAVLNLENAAATDAAPETLFAVQLALYLLHEIFTPAPAAASAAAPAADSAPAADAAPVAAIAAAMKKNAAAAARLLGRFRELAPAAPEEPASFDWHEVKEDGVLPWARIIHEMENAAVPAAAAVAILQTPDIDTVRSYADSIREMLLAVPWEKLRLGRAVTPAALIHALGVARGLWDEDLKEFTPSFDGTASLVECFLDPAYDADNPDKSGHTAAVPRKERDEFGGGGEKRKNSPERRSHGGRGGDRGNTAEGGAGGAANNGGAGGKSGGSRHKQRFRRHGGKNRGGGGHSGSAPAAPAPRSADE